MTEIDVVDVLRDGLWTGLLISGPLLLVALVVGLVIGFIQALTQIQEATLSFIPKIVAMVAMTILLLPFMIGQLVAYTDRLADMITAVG